MHRYKKLTVTETHAMKWKKATSFKYGKEEWHMSKEGIVMTNKHKKNY